MARIYDCDGLQIGAVEAAADGVVAFDIDDRRIGLFETRLEAVSACFAAWRRDGQLAASARSEEFLLETIEAISASENSAI